MIKKINQYFDKIVTFFLCILVIVMCFLSLVSILSRLANWGQDWIDPLVRHMVLFSAFLGATLAISTGEHISMDLLAKTLKVKGNIRAKFWLDGFNKVLALVVCLFLFDAARKLYLMEIQYEKMAFLGISSAQLVMIVPIGMGLLAFKFLLVLLNQLFLAKGNA